jgi:Domain of unknown function (DUF4156)
MNKLIALSVACLFSACTWVEPDAAGKRVAVTFEQNHSHCTHKAKVTVSVKHKVGVYTRNDIKVRDELESLARNQAADIGANTIQAIADPKDGEQVFDAWACP